MSSTPSPVARLIAEEVMRGSPLAGVLGAAESAGHDLAEVLDVLTAPFDHLAEPEAAEVEAAVFEWNDVIYELVEYTGMEVATEVARRSVALAGEDVRSRHTSFKARLRALSAIVEKHPIADAYDLVADDAISPEDRAWLLARIAHAYPLEDLGAIATRVSSGDAAAVGAVLRRRQSALDALESLLGDATQETILVVLETFWSVTCQAGDARTALLRTYAALCRAAFRPLDGPLRFAATHGDPRWWLPPLREHGLKGSHAALRLLENGTDRLTIAQLLSDAGYADVEVMTALLENGVGVRTSLSTLRDSGWRLDAMVKTLAERGELLPEVRRHLEDLGLPRSAQRQVLVEHWPEPIVDLVLAGADPSELLSSGD